MDIYTTRYNSSQITIWHVTHCQILRTGQSTGATLSSNYTPLHSFVLPFTLPNSFVLFNVPSYNFSHGLHRKHILLLPTAELHKRRFWRWCIMYFFWLVLDFIHRLVCKRQKTTTFRRLDLSPSSGGLGRINLLSWAQLSRWCGSGWGNIQKTYMLRDSTHWQSDGTSVSKLAEDISRNKLFPLVLITLVLCSISICDLFTNSLSQMNSHKHTNKVSTYSVQCAMKK
jgi:hypothetical protein